MLYEKKKKKKGILSFIMPNGTIEYNCLMMVSCAENCRYAISQDAMDASHATHCELFIFAIGCRKA